MSNISMINDTWWTSSNHPILEQESVSNATVPDWVASTSADNNSISHHVTPMKIFIGVILYFITILTIVGNLLVLIAVAMESRLRTIFNCYVVNLAITDVTVALLAMSFYSLDVVLGYWPFGEFMCAVWIFFDYGMTFASVFTLVVISVDRFWSVTWSIHYRQHHSKGKAIILIAGLWVLMLVLWLPPCLTDRIQNSKHMVCIWEPSLNRTFVIIMDVIGHYIPLCIMVFCYTKVFIFMRNRKLRKGGRGVLFNNRIQPSASATNDSRPACTVDINTIPESLSLPTNQIDAPQTSTSTVNMESIETARNELIREDKEGKVFVMLTCILAGYIFFWFPFYVVFDVSAALPSVVPDVIYSLAFYWPYLNSTINPFLYNLSSTEYRHAFKMILSLRYWR